MSDHATRRPFRFSTREMLVVLAFAAFLGAVFSKYWWNVEPTYPETIYNFQQLVK